MQIHLCICTVLVVVAVPVLADDSLIRQQIINDDTKKYLDTGHPCPCPYNLQRNGSRCNSRSAYIRPNGKSPLCYTENVTCTMILEWLAQHQQLRPISVDRATVPNVDH